MAQWVNLPVHQLFLISAHLPRPLSPTATCMRSEETKQEMHRPQYITQRSTAMEHWVHGARQISSRREHYLVISMLFQPMALSISMEDEVVLSNMPDKMLMELLAHGLPRQTSSQLALSRRSWQLPTASSILWEVRPTVQQPQHIPIKLPQPRSTL